MTVPQKLAELRQKMKNHGFSAYVIPTGDPHLCEYVPNRYKTREYISGFTGSAGTVALTMQTAGLWTDGRYFLQAEKQLEGSGITLYKMDESGVPTLNAFLKKALKPGEKLGIDGKTLSVQNYESIKEELDGIKIVTDTDLIGDIWKDRPEPVFSSVFIHEKKYAGKTAAEKIEQVRALLKEKNADSTLIGALEDVCWLFNIRARDVAYNPVATAYALVTAKKALLFIDAKQVSADVKKRLVEQNITVMPYEAVFSEAQKLTGNVYLDPERTNVYLYGKVKAHIIKGLNFTSSLKAVKNSVELRNMDDTMEKDGVAMVKILRWVEQNAGSGITEGDVSEKLLEFRAQGKDFIEESFETIAGYGANGAVIHYTPHKSSCAKLKNKSFLLLDSGAHYINGTTDITRTVPLGPLTNEEKENYTLVLKSHIALACAKFKAGTIGHALDAITRRCLWERGKDYNHGTGHGVGYVLAVHEGPQSISKRYINEAIKLGMITSNEPGLYIENKHGIRIESLIVSIPFLKTAHGEFYQFKTITLCPIDARPIVSALLTKEEKEWLNDYHQEVFARLSPYLDRVHKAFLREKTKKIK